MLFGVSPGYNGELFAIFVFHPVVIEVYIAIVLPNIINIEFNLGTTTLRFELVNEDRPIGEHGVLDSNSSIDSMRIHQVAVRII